MEIRSLFTTAKHAGCGHRFSAQLLRAGQLLGCLFLLGLGGCGGSDYKVVPVSGLVTKDGSPLPSVVVTFQPVAGSGGVQAGVGSSAVTDSQGRYALKLATAEQSPGAVVGRHRVTFAAQQAERSPSDDTAAPPAAEIVPVHYQLNPLEFEVPAEGTDKADFTLQSAVPGGARGATDGGT